VLGSQRKLGGLPKLRQVVQSLGQLQPLDVHEQ